MDGLYFQAKVGSDAMSKTQKFAIVMGGLFVGSIFVRNGDVLFNAILAFSIIGIIATQLFVNFDEFNDLERFGLGVIGGGMILSTPALWLPDTPFNSWSFNVARFGVALYLFADFRRRAHDKKALAIMKGWIVK